MRKVLLTSAIMALAAAPAFAANGTPAGSDENQSGGGGQDMNQPAGQSGGGGQTSGQHGRIGQQITQRLSQAGFTDVHVMPQSFLVRAKDPNGNPVIMVINPDSVTAVTAIVRGGQTGQGGGSQAGQGAGSDAMGTSTTTNSAQSGNAPNGNGAPTTR